MRVIGIDPSVKATGFGILDYSSDDSSVICYGTIKPSGKLLFHHKMNDLRKNIEDLIQAYAPGEMAIENLFYAQNIKTAISLGQVRGAVLIAAASHDLNLFEYSPLEIKKAVTGYGQAEKGQVITMVKTLLKIEDNALESDAADALATAICHMNIRIFQMRMEES